MICGGDDTRDSNCLADWVVACLELRGVKIAGVSDANACGVNPDGTWYEWPRTTSVK